MMVFVLGDNFEFLLQFCFGQNRRISSLFVDVTHEILDCEFFIRSRTSNSKKTQAQIHQDQNYFSREEIILFFRTLPRSVQKLLKKWMSINATKWTFLVVLCAAV